MILLDQHETKQLCVQQALPQNSLTSISWRVLGCSSFPPGMYFPSLFWCLLFILLVGGKFSIESTMTALLPSSPFASCPQPIYADPLIKKTRKGPQSEKTLSLHLFQCRNLNLEMFLPILPLMFTTWMFTRYSDVYSLDVYNSDVVDDECMPPALHVSVESLNSFRNLQRASTPEACLHVKCCSYMSNAALTSALLKNSPGCFYGLLRSLGFKCVSRIKKLCL